MRPKKVATDPEAIYRSGPSIRQQKFPDRRSHVKQRRSLPAKLEKEQSTLTQRWSFSSGINDGQDELEDIEDEDAQYEPERPKKRRRKTISGGKNGRRKLGERQNTMTQMGFVTSSFGTGSGDEEAGRDSEDDIAVFPCQEKEETKMEDEEEMVPESVSSQQGGMATKRMALGTDSSSPHYCPENTHSRYPRDPSVEIPYTVGQPITPRKRFPHGMEIPSSNTPMSAILFSGSSRRTTRSPTKSPLMERGTNGLPALGEVDRSSIHESPVAQITRFSPYSKSKTDIFRRPDMPASKVPKLLHRSTIPDSEDTPIEETQLPRSPVKLRVRKGLQRVRSTIQDTQCEGLGQEITADTEKGDSDHEYEHQQSFQDLGGTMDLSYPYFDTVADALARDAARYGQTQRLQSMRHAIGSGGVLDTQGGSDRDLLAMRSQITGTAVDFASVRDADRSIDEEVGLRDHGAEQPGDDVSMHSQSLPATPGRPERTRHHPRFHDIEVVDLTAESFEPALPFLSGSPTPKTGSQAPIKVGCVDSSPSMNNKHISSSPPFVRGHATDDDVEHLPLNDLNHSHLEDGGSRHVPSSQVSTVGHLTQAFRSQQPRVRIKKEHEDMCSAVPRIRRDADDDIDLDPEAEDEDDDIDQIILSNADLNEERIEHIDLSEHNDPGTDDDDGVDYVNVDDIHHRYHIGGVETPTPSSPLPIPPGHVAAEYDDVARDEVSSDLTIHITSPPAESSQMDDHDPHSPPISHTSPAMHMDDEDSVVDEDTPRAVRVRALPRKPLSEKARGKQPLYQIHTQHTDLDVNVDGEMDQDSASGSELDLPTDHHDNHNHNVPPHHHHPHDANVGQYSYQFRRAEEILPDTQLSVMLPPVPPSYSSDDFGRREEDEREREHEQEECRDVAQVSVMEDVSLAAPPKSSFGWRKNRAARE